MLTGSWKKRDKLSVNVNLPDYYNYSETFNEIQELHKTKKERNQLDWN